MGYSTYILVITSTFIYLSLGFTSLNYYLKLRYCDAKVSTEKIHGFERVLKGTFNEIKSTFFIVLAISSFLELPFYIICIGNGAPYECRSNSTITDKILWILHIVALMGFAVCLSIPLFLWSDIINGRDGQLWNSVHKLNGPKLFLYSSNTIYFLLQIVRIVDVVLFQKYDISYHPQNNNSTNADYFKNDLSYVSGTFDPLICLLIAFGWLWIGLRLQSIVQDIQFRLHGQSKALFTVNCVMGIVVFSYMCRAFFSLTLLPCCLVSSVRSFFLFIVFTRWLPLALCSFLLIYVMRQTDGKSSPAAVSGERDQEYRQFQLLLESDVDFPEDVDRSYLDRENWWSRIWGRGFSLTSSSASDRSSLSVSSMFANCTPRDARCSAT